MKTIKARCPYCNEPTVQYMVVATIPAVLYIYTKDGSVDSWELDIDESVERRDWSNLTEGLGYGCANCGRDIDAQDLDRDIVIEWLKEAEHG